MTQSISRPPMSARRVLAESRFIRYCAPVDDLVHIQSLLGIYSVPVVSPRVHGCAPIESPTSGGGRGVDLIKPTASLGRNAR
eukprot:14610313-Alexandrium_andersonii.AAC.1